MTKETGIGVYNAVMKIALSLPLVKVNRESFLRNIFSDYCSKEVLDQIIEENPRKYLDIDLLDSLANSVIKKMQIEVTLIAGASGLPGNPFAAGGLALFDMAQYTGFCFNICQKLAYIYGYPNLLSKDGEVSESMVGILVPMLGVMFGAGNAAAAVNMMAKVIAKNIGKKLPQYAFGHAGWYLMIKSISGFLGKKMSKQLFAKQFAKAVPLLGGMVSGGITYAAFGPSARKLALQLRYNSRFFYDPSNITSEQTEEAQFEEVKI